MLHKYRENRAWHAEPAQTMGDIVIREDGGIGNVIYAVFSGWEAASDSDTMDERDSGLEAVR